MSLHTTTMNKTPDRIGVVMGDWKILKQLPTHKTPSGTLITKYLVKCTSCSLEKETSWRSLNNRFNRKGSARCWCTLKPELSAKAKKQFTKGTKDITGSYISGVRCSAKKRGLSYTLTDDYLQTLLEKQTYKCVYTGVSITTDSGNLRSLDRIDSSKGYDKGNVQWVTWEVNRMKGALNESEFLQLADTITQYRI